MQIINPSVELWPAPEAWQEQVARAARLCYASEGGKKSAEEFCDMLHNRNHRSMFRHGSRYFSRLKQNYTHICFHRGYTKTTMLVELKGLFFGCGRPEWGAPKGVEVLILKLGKIEKQ